MGINEFKNALKDDKPNAEWSHVLKALWYDAKGDWSKAHEQVDQFEDADSCAVHAYLHRKEGDNWNADYWYRRAGSTRPQIPLAKEFEELVNRLL